MSSAPRRGANCSTRTTGRKGVSPAAGLSEATERQAELSDTEGD